MTGSVASLGGYSYPGSSTATTTTTTTTTADASTTSTTLPDPCDAPGLAGLGCRLGIAATSSFCDGALAGSKSESSLKSGLAATKTLVERAQAATKPAKRRMLIGKAVGRLKQLAKLVKRNVKGNVPCAEELKALLAGLQTSLRQLK